LSCLHNNVHLSVCFSCPLLSCPSAWHYSLPVYIFFPSAHARTACSVFSSLSLCLHLACPCFSCPSACMKVIPPALAACSRISLLAIPSPSYSNWSFPPVLQYTGRKNRKKFFLHWEISSGRMPFVFRKFFRRRKAALHSEAPTAPWNFFMEVLHRVLTHPPPLLLSPRRQVKIIWTSKIPPLPQLG
jgi:hypothetical protein